MAELRKKSEELLSKLDPIEEMAHEFFKLSAQMQDRERRKVLIDIPICFTAYSNFR